MTSLYVATRVITYFGTELRTFWEHVVCRICRIAAEDVRAFKSGELCGHVEHELVRTRTQAFLMCWFPFTMNFIISCMLLLSGSYNIWCLGDYGSFKSWLFLWVGFSCAANCVPSFEDVLSFKDFFYGKESNVFLKILLAPFFGIIYAGAYLERYSLTFILGIIFTLIFPTLLDSVLPFIEKIAFAVAM